MSQNQKVSNFIRGGGLKISEIQKVLHLIRGGRGRNFSKSSEIQNVPIWSKGGQHFLKMSEIQKCPNLVRRGGQHFSKMSEIQKCPKGRRGGGVNPNWDIVQKFSRFSILTPPLTI